MLILSRKLGEKIIINDNITLTIISLDKERVKIGIEAPNEIKIIREELLWTKNKNTTAN